MALVGTATYSVVISMVDRDNNKSTLGVSYPSGNTIANITSEVTGSLIPAIEGISDAVVSGFSIATGASETDPAVLAGAPETSDVERKGSFVFRAANGATMALEVPSVRNTLVVDGTNVLDKNDADVAAFIAAFLTAGVDGLAPSSYLGSALVALEGAPKKIHRKSRKG